MPAVHVAVGVILDGQHNILLTRRALDAHQGGLWEFPGGKVEAGETLHLALARELHEELDIRIGRTTALIEVGHDYGDKSVLLDVYVVWSFDGVARGVQQQPLVWVPVTDLRDYTFPVANEPIITALEALLLAD